MNDHFNEQISEFIDDEMSVEESEFFVRRLQRDDTARRQYLRYQLIGAAVRGEYRYPGASELRQRLGEALDNDRVAPAGQSSWMQLAGGVAIAASVVVVAILGLRLIAPAAAPADAGPVAGFAAASDAPASIVPVAAIDQQAPAEVPAVTGIQYLINHAQYTSGMNRTIVQSSVVAGRESDLVAASLEASIE